MNDHLADALIHHLAKSPELRDREAYETAGFSQPVWSAFAQELGLLGLRTPREHGGLDASAAEVGRVMEALGRALVLEPVLETAILAAALLRRSGRQDPALTGQLIDGAAVFAFAHCEDESGIPGRAPTTRAEARGDGFVLNGEKPVVAAAPNATHLIVTATLAGPAGADLGVFLLTRGLPGVAMDAYRLIDGRPAADVHLRDVVVGKDAVIASGHEAEEILAATFDEAVAAVCSEAVGVMRRAFDDTVAFLQARRQFGRPLSTFQALRHRVADMYLALETAAAAAELAYDNLDATPDRRAAAVSAAKVEVARCGRSIVQSAVHLHGAIGTTTELAVGRCFKRMAVIEGLFGGSDEHLRRYASIRAAPATA